jgi:serine/threonine protein kinase
MTIILDTDNVFEYLADLNYCNLADRATSQVKVLPAKNFNLWIKFSNDSHLSIKQEVRDFQGKTTGEFNTAWQVQQLFDHFPDLNYQVKDYFQELLYFDIDSSILVVKYLDDYEDLQKYYTKEQQFPVIIAKSIGQLLGSIHAQTFQQVKYQQFWQDAQTKIYQQSGLADNSELLPAESYAHDIIQRLSRITPQVFQMMPQDCWQFFKLYQRFPSLSQAIFELDNSINPSCLVHNDLKLNNILLDLNWESPSSKIIRLIDWESAEWGDPAFDLGCILGSYLEIWLDGLFIDHTLSINESLQLAATPLELLQPSLSALVCAYLEHFPAILKSRPDYLDRAIQFAGLALIQRIEITIDEDRIFGNRGILMLQVAKQLLCSPKSAMNTLFGDHSINR